MKLLLVLLASCVVLGAAQSNLLADVVQAILQNTPDISVHDCSAKCDHVFQFLDRVDEAVSDYQCAQLCACQIAHRCLVPLVATHGLKRRHHHHHVEQPKPAQEPLITPSSDEPALPTSTQSEQWASLPSASPRVAGATGGQILTVSYGDQSTTRSEPSVTPVHHSRPSHHASTQSEQSITSLPTALPEVAGTTEGPILTVSYGDWSTTRSEPSVTPVHHSRPSHHASTKSEQSITSLPSALPAVAGTIGGPILTVSYGDWSTTRSEPSVTPVHHSRPSHHASTKSEQSITSLPSALPAVAGTIGGPILTVSYGDWSTTRSEPSVTPVHHSRPSHHASTQTEQSTTSLPSASPRVADVTDGSILTVSYGDKSTTRSEPSVTPVHHSRPSHHSSFQTEQSITSLPSALPAVAGTTGGPILTVSYGDWSTTRSEPSVTPVHHSRPSHHASTQSEQSITSLPTALPEVAGTTEGPILTVSYGDWSTTRSEPSVTPVHHSRPSHHSSFQTEQSITSLPSALPAVAGTTGGPILTVSYGDWSTTRSEPFVTPVHHPRPLHYASTQSEQSTTSLPSASPRVADVTDGPILTVSYGDRSTTRSEPSVTPVHHSRPSHHASIQSEQSITSLQSALPAVAGTTGGPILTVSYGDWSTTRSEPFVTPVHHPRPLHYASTQSEQSTTSLPSASPRVADVTDGPILTVSYGDWSTTRSEPSVTPVHHSRPSHHASIQSEQSITSLPSALPAVAGTTGGPILTVSYGDQSTTRSEPSVTPVHHSRPSHHASTQSEQSITSLPTALPEVAGTTEGPILTVSYGDWSTTRSEPSVTPVHHSRPSHHSSFQTEQSITSLPSALPAVAGTTGGPILTVSYGDWSTTRSEPFVTPVHHSRPSHYASTQSEQSTTSLPSASPRVADVTDGPILTVSYGDWSTTRSEPSVTPVHHSRPLHHASTQSGPVTTALPSTSTAIPVQSTTALDASVTPVHL